MEKLCLLAGLSPYTPNQPLNHGLLPSHQPPWQKSGCLSVLDKRKKQLSFKNQINEKKFFYTYYKLSHVIKALENYNFRVVPLNKKCLYLCKFLYIVNGERLVPSQLIMRLNKTREEKSLKDSILVDGLTDGEEKNE